MFPAERNGARFQSFNQAESVTIPEESVMPRNSNRGGRNNNPTGRNQYSDWGVMEMARERPIAAAAAAAGAAAAGLFLWSKRSAISQQLSNLSDQIGEWTEGMGWRGGDGFEMDDTAGLTSATPTKRSRAGSRSASGTRSATANRSSGTAGKNRGMSETGGGNASIGAHSGGMGTGGNS
jgi:hypothetical protein